MNRINTRQSLIPMAGIIVLCIALTCCQLQTLGGSKGLPGNQQTQVSSSSGGGNSQLKASIMAAGMTVPVLATANNVQLVYPYGLPTAMSVDQTKYLQSEYADWKANYVTKDGAGGYLRVKTDLATKFDTVSEGMGYGMLLAVYFDDQPAFDQLYGYVLQHQTPWGLMHWMVLNNNVNVSEFWLPIPHGAVYSNIVTGALATMESGGLTTAGVNTPVPKAEQKNYIEMCQYKRGWSDASDANQDIAAALILASARWRNKSQYYTIQAASNIINIINTNVDAYNYIMNGGMWGGKRGFNPSYFSPAFMGLFNRFIAVNSANIPALAPLTAKINATIANMYNQFGTIGAGGANPLFPDWCNTYTGKVLTCAGTGLSDRKYYIILDPAGTCPRISIGGIEVCDDVDKDGDGTLDSAIGAVNFDAYDMLSFNYYYDAVRVPWRQSICYSWYGGTTALNIVKNIENFVKLQLANPAGLVDGYSIDGSPWNLSNRDGFNPGAGGKYQTTTFYAMNATGALPCGDPTYAQMWYAMVSGKKDAYSDTNNYYGNTLRMLSLLYLSGNFINFYDGWTVKTARNPAQYVTAGPLTIDLSYTDYGVYGLSRCDFHDRAKLYNFDGSSWGNIGGGTLNSKAGDFVILRSCSSVGNVSCGLSTLVFDTAANVYGTVLAEYNVSCQDPKSPILYGDGFFLSNINSDVGCMDFSVADAGFTVNMNNSINLDVNQSTTVKPGVYGDVMLKSGAKITFTSGIYYFNSYDAEPAAMNYMDTSGGPIIIFVKGDFNMKSSVKMLKPDGITSADPAEILVVVDSQNTVYIAPGASWRGTLIAPKSSYVNIDIGANDSRGAFWGNFVEVHQGDIVYQVGFDWSSAISKGLVTRK